MDYESLMCHASEIVAAIKDTAEERLTKREHIAAMIAQGLVAHNGTFGETGSPQLIAGRAVFVADLLLAELGKST